MWLFYFNISSNIINFCFIFLSRMFKFIVYFCHTPTDGGNIGMRRTNCSKQHNTKCDNMNSIILLKLKNNTLFQIVNIDSNIV
ncbi:hypothetical protein HanHA89_Chr02g0041161 [Helianthus annuus]|nr:hypothetical protein HanHA89_Chr02g0041161 [Helianthus annuus]